MAKKKRLKLGFIAEVVCKNKKQFDKAFEMMMHFAIDLEGMEDDEEIVSAEFAYGPLGKGDKLVVLDNKGYVVEDTMGNESDKD